MPVNDFPGQRNWGYDGVLPFAPDRAYGSPDDLKALVDAAHDHGLMIFLDVVYNHFGPDGNYLRLRAAVLPRRCHDAVGAGDRFPPPRGAPLLHRERALLADGISLRRAALRRGARDHRIRLARRDGGAKSAPPSSRTATSIWCSSTTAMSPSICAAISTRNGTTTGITSLHVHADRRERGLLRRLCGPPRPSGWRAALREGFVYQGEPSRASRRRAARDAERRPAADCLRAVPAEPRPDRQSRFRRPPDRERRAARRSKPPSRCSCSCPQIPLIFMGEEVGSATPFQFFTDHHGELADAVREGRRSEFASFAAFSDPARRAQIPDPNAAETFERSRPAPDAECGAATIARSIGGCSHCGASTSCRALKAPKRSARRRSALRRCWRDGGWRWCGADARGKSRSASPARLEQPAGD